MSRARDISVFRKELDSVNNFYVYDARPRATPVLVMYAKALTAASPNNDHYSQQRKQLRFRRHFMPVWGLDELQRCREHCYNEPGITEESVAHMFGLVGGTARHVFVETPEGEDAAMHELRLAVAGMTVQMYVRSRVWCRRHVYNLLYALRFNSTPLCAHMHS